MGRLCLCIAWIISGVFYLGAQQELSDGFPEAGDSLYLIETNIRKEAFPEKSGENLTWNFLFLDAPYVKEILFYPAREGSYYEQFPEADLVAIGANRDETYFLRDGLGVVEVGRYGQLPWMSKRTGLIKFDSYLITKKSGADYNTRYQHRIDQSFLISMDELIDWGITSLPFSGESLRMDVNIETEYIIDGEGEVLLPFGNYPVLQERIDIVINTSIFVKTEMGWEEIDPDYVSIEEGFLQLGKQRKTNYRYWTPEFTYPLLSLEDSNGKSYHVTYINDDKTSQLFTATNRSKDILALPNPSFGEVTFQFLNFAPGEYTLQLYNIINKPLYQEKLRVGPSLQKQVDLSFLDKGTYIYSIIDANGKKLFTKKIVILRL